MKRNAGGDPATDTANPFKIDLLAKWRALGAITADRNLSAGALAVAWQLLNHTDAQTGIAWPGIERMADRTGFSPRAVERAVAMLIAAGWFIKTRQGGKKRGQSNRYAFARWATPAATTGISGETPAPTTNNPVANRQVTPAPMTSDSPYESPYDSRQRNLRVFGKVEGGANASVPKARKAPSPAERISATLSAAEWQQFHRDVAAPLAVIGQANTAEAEREGAGAELIRAALEAAPKRAMGAAR